MAVGRNLAYSCDMSWQDYLSEEERAELDNIRSAKEKAVDAYNSVYRKLKTRCDARMRRAKESENSVQKPDAKG